MIAVNCRCGKAKYVLRWTPDCLPAPQSPQSPIEYSLHWIANQFPLNLSASYRFIVNVKVTTKQCSCSVCGGWMEPIQNNKTIIETHRQSSDTRQRPGEYSNSITEPSTHVAQWMRHDIDRQFIVRMASPGKFKQTDAIYHALQYVVWS